MKVTFVLPSLTAGGMEIMALSLGKELLRRGHDLSIVCTTEAGPLAAAAKASGMHVQVESPRRRGSVIHPQILTGILARLAPQAVHVHGAPLLKAAIAARRAQTPLVVYSLHGLPSTQRLRSYLSMRMGARLADIIVAVSTDLEGYAAARLGVARAKRAVIPNGVDTQRFAPERAATLRTTLQLSRDIPLVGIIARFDPVKDHASALIAWAAVSRQVPAARLVLIGDGPTRRSVESLASSLGISGRIHFIGTHHDPAALLTDLDIVALSSVSEGLPMALLEAMSAARPVVATAVGGIPGLLADGAGMLVPANQPHALAQALVTLLRDPIRRNALGQRGRQKVLAQYSLTHMADAYESVYATTVRSTDIDRPPF